MLIPTDDLHPEGSKASSRSQKTYTGEVKDLCHQAERSLGLESDAQHEDEEVCIRKTIRSKLLLENKQPTVFPSSSLFMVIGNNPQVDRPCHTDSVQLGVTS
ncbi:hypothetical protein H920_10382 [Fukomys damarensis]|uniref:Uncharacterized protein n=1 Tax=Fukomys damarensis TaxID=885580 RepID=A0A091DDC3_FUKDA|nr:hypothetical protein H920_10382 [Fukomys damarensis]